MYAGADDGGEELCEIERRDHILAGM